jgi:hypothetical protein
VVSKMMMWSLPVPLPADGAATVLDGLADMDRFPFWRRMDASLVTLSPEHARGLRLRGS